MDPSHIYRVVRVLLTGDPRRQRASILWLAAAALLLCLVGLPRPSSQSVQLLLSLGLPPIPVLTEASSIVIFCTRCLDDAVEDLAKALALVLLVRGQRALLRRFGLGRWSVAATVGSLVALYPLCDTLADRAGEHAEAVQAALLWLLMGEAAPLEREACKVVCSEEAASAGLLAVVDDGVEDGFKAFCVWSHYSVGSALGAVVFSGMLASPHRPVRATGAAAAAVVRLGSPLAQYASCDDYADRLGDLAPGPGEKGRTRAARRVPRAERRLPAEQNPRHAHSFPLQVQASLAELAGVEIVELSACPVRRNRHRRRLRRRRRHAWWAPSWAAGVRHVLGDAYLDAQECSAAAGADSPEMTTAGEM